MTRNQNQKAEAHARAQEAWDAVERKKGGSPRRAVSGLAERIRGSNRKPKTAEHKRAEREAMHRQMAQTLKRNTRTFQPARIDDSKYLPHQGPRECARRVRQGLSLPEMAEAAQ